MFKRDRLQPVLASSPRYIFGDIMDARPVPFTDYLRIADPLIDLCRLNRFPFFNGLNCLVHSSSHCAAAAGIDMPAHCRKGSRQVLSWLSVQPLCKGLASGFTPDRMPDRGALIIRQLAAVHLRHKVHPHFVLCGSACTVCIGGNDDICVPA